MSKREDLEEEIGRARMRTREAMSGDLGISVSTFDRWIDEGRIPPALKGTRFWDSKAVHAALDAASGLKESSRPSSWDSWRGRKGNAGAAQGR